MKEQLIHTLISVYNIIQALFFIPSLNQIPLSYTNSKQISLRRHNFTELFIQQAKIKQPSNSYIPDAFAQEPHLPVQLVNATILVLCRNWELDDILSSMRSLEDKFNNQYHYPWTFLNDVEFTEEFKEWTTAMASGPTEYGLIPAEDWNTPEHINQTKYEECLKAFEQEGVLYGNSRSYRNMCHFNSGYFFRQELTLKYDYYFRVEPGVEYFCDFQMDPFRLMHDNKKKYGFVVTFYEYPNTIPGLFDSVNEFFGDHPDYLHPSSAKEFITNWDTIGDHPVTIEAKGAEEYNMCHFWSNFEIGDLNFFRSKEYIEFFEHLSSKGGFYYERWGDAPVHTIAAALLLDKEEIYHFEDIGYGHVPFRTFPSSRSISMNKRCILPPTEDYFDDINLTGHGCLNRWWKFGSGKRFIKEYFYKEDYIA